MLPPIDAIDVLEVRVPRSERNRITTSYATLPDAHHALVLIHADGLVGLGEAPAERWWTGEDAATVRNAIENYFAPTLLGGPRGIRECVALMDAALVANEYAKAAIEMALWDLLGKAAQLPLGAVLGGSGRPVPIKYVIGMVEPAHARQLAEHARAEGFGYLKVKVGGELDDDLARCEAVAGTLGPGDRYGIDVNGGWRLDVALAALEPLRSVGVAFLEQPVDRAFPWQLAEVTARSEIPVVAHESVFTVRDGFLAASQRWAHIWALTPSTHGGLVRTLDLLGVARAAGIPCLIGSTVELGIATAFMAHIASAFENIVECPVPSDILGPLYHEGDVVLTQPRIDGGLVHPPEGPGLGVALDEDAIARFRVS